MLSVVMLDMDKNIIGYHMYEWTAYYKISPSWLDEQRIENIHPFLRPIWQKYKRLGGKKQLKYVGKCYNNKILLRVKKSITKKSV